MDSTANLRNERPHWICCQIGAREHYAIPRAVLGRGSEATLLTDVWSTDGCRWLLPQRWKQRCHPDVPDRCVRGWTFESWLRSVRSRLAGRSGWSEILERNQWFQRRAAAAVEEICRTATHPPIVFSYSYSAEEIFRVAKRHGCTTILGQIDPAVVEVELIKTIEQKHGLTKSEWPPESYWKRWTNECELADVIVVNSEWSRTALIQQKIDANKLRIVPLAYDNQSSFPGKTSFPVRFSASRPLRILFLGQVIPRKGAVELLEAARISQSAPIEWRVVGGGPNTLLSRLRALPNVVVTGQVSRADVAQEYQNADVFILPTHSDGFALTQLEAKAYGLPIIASRFCGHVVDDQETGLILNEITPLAISEAALTLVNSPQLVQEFSTNQKRKKPFGISELGKCLTELCADAGKQSFT